ncbi:MAG: aspartate/glutamate racemase family protein [Chloroflexi bacterium]|nr:aspartate/glutamate racemase family protein [Chloroflexota bacterium]MCL5274075.1 aspartate/glutamate racemase family protein [Chloroflexota bacterium]
MKTIGLIGGMSWESSVEYYRIINEVVHARLGGLHSAQCLMYSVDFAEIEMLQHEGRWDEAARSMIDAAQRLERGGADFAVLCTNTMHKLAGAMEQAMTIPLLHIADATAEKILAQGLTTVGLLGTRFTMEEDFYRGRLTERFGLRVLIPSADECEVVHRVIYDELVLGQIRADSRQRYIEFMERLVGRGAQGIILGCTEIGLLVHDEDCRAPLFDTTRIHAEAAVAFALA